MAKVILDPNIDFSLVQGGPLFQLFRWSHLLNPPTDLLPRRIIAITLIAWLPLLILATLEGNLFANTTLPFLFDISVHTRFLLCIPLLVAAEVIVHSRLRILVRQFTDCGIVAPHDQPRFDQCIATAMRLRNSIPAEILIFVLAILAGLAVNDRYVNLQTSTWFMTLPDSSAAHTTTLAGHWYFYVSLTIGRFLLLRWYFRILIWYFFLFRVVRTVPLKLNPLHPDHAAGLSFLSESAFAFQPILLAQTVAISGIIAGKIFFQSAHLVDFKMEIAFWITFLVLLVLTPLMFFAGRLAHAKRTGSREYGVVASLYVANFWNKWIESPAPPNADLLGTSDIQSLADLSNSFAVVREMRIVPFSWSMVVRIAVITALPILPLLLTMISLEELIIRGLQMLL